MSQTLEERQRELAVTGLEKRAELSGTTPGAQLLREFNAEQDLIAQQGRAFIRERRENAPQSDYYRARIANRVRTPEESLKDRNLSLLGGATNLIAGAGLLAGDLVAQGQGAIYGDEWEGTLRENLLTPATQLLGDFNQWRNDSASAVKQADSAIRAEEDLAAAAESEARYNADFAATAGDSAASQLAQGFLASAKRLGRDFAQGAGNMLKHPTSLSDAVVEQVPTLALGAVAKGVLTAEAVAARGSAIALMREKQGLEALSAPALRELAETQLATRNLVAGVGATEAGSSYGQEAGEILGVDLSDPIQAADLKARFPDAGWSADPTTARSQIFGSILAGIEAGKDPKTLTEADYQEYRAAQEMSDEALFAKYPEFAPNAAQDERVKAQLASQVGLTSAAIVAPLAALAGRASAGLNLNPLGRKGAQSIAAGLRADGKDVLGEVLEETVQGGVSETAGNIANFLAGDEDADILEGVGGAAGQGAATAGVFAGGLRAPSVAKTAAVGAAKAAIAPILKYGEEKQEKLDARTILERERVNVANETAADTVSQSLQTTVPESKAAAAVQADPLLDPEDVASVQRGDTATSRLQAATRLLSRLSIDQTLTPEKKQDYRLFVGKVVRELRQEVNTIQDPELAAQITQLTENPMVRKIEQAFVKTDPEVMEQLLAGLPADIADDVELTPEQSKSLAQVVEVAHIAPDQISKPLAMKALSMAKRLKPEEVKQLELAVKVAENKEQHEAAVAKIQGKYKGSKAAPAVRHEIEEEGFNTGRSYKSSLSEYVRNVSTAMAEGRIQDAKTEMGNLQRFALHMQNRAQAFDDAATQQVAEGMEDKPYEVAVGGTIKDGQLDTKSKFKLNLAPGSRSEQGGKATMEYVFADANSVAQTYNTLAEQFGDVIGASTQDKVPLQSRLTTDLKPTYNTARSREEAAARLTSKQEKTEPKAETKTEEKLVPKKAEKVEPKAEPEKTEPAPEVAPAPEPEVQEEVAPVEEAAVEETPAPEAEPVAEEVVIPKLTVDFGAAPTEEAQAELAQALAMTDAEYLAAVNPEGKTTEVPSDQAINEELADTEPSSRAVEVGQVGDVTLMADGDYLYAVQNEETVGLLVNKEGGSQLYVHSSQRGKGLGKAMIRELLVRNPLALTNGLSPAARATRLSVLRDLRAEAAAVAEEAPVAEPLQDGTQVPEVEPTEALPAKADFTVGLIDSLKGSKNKFLTAFRALKSKTSLFARMENPLQKLIEALKKDDPESLLLEKDQHLKFTESQVSALKTITEKFVPAIIDMMNKNLNDAANGRGLDAHGNPRKGKGFIQDLLNPEGSNIPAWDFIGNQSLHVVTEENGKLAYQPEVAQAMALSAVHWMLRTVSLPAATKMEDVAPMFEDKIVPQNLLALYETSHYYEQPLRSLAQDIMRTLGLQADPDAPRDHSDGIAKALAADAARALSNLGALNITYERGPKKEDFVFLKFNTEGPNSLQEVLEQFGNLNGLTRLLQPDNTQLPFIGQPSTKVATRTKGSNHPLSKKLRENLRNKQNIPFFINGGFLDFLNTLGGYRVQDLQGYRDVDLETLNKNDRRVVEGTNRGLEMSWANLRDIVEEMKAYAAANNVPLSQTPAYYAWSVISNTRMTMDGPSPQSDKLIREVLTANRKTIDLADPKMVNEYHMTIAQALGIKTEQMTNAQAIMETQAGFAEGGKYAVVIQSIKELLTDTENKQLKDDIADQMRALKIDTTRAIHALYAQAQFELNKEPTFEHSIPFELDGKTDGPIHAIMHFGLQAFSTKMLKQLRQGGVFINETQKPTLNQWGKTLGDLYGNASVAMTEGVSRFMANKKGQIRDVMTAALAQMRLLDYATSLDDADPFGSIKLERSLAKLAFAPMIYGSSAHSIHVKLADEILKNIYAQISQAIANDQPLDRETQWDITQLMGYRPIFNRKKQVTGYEQVPLPALGNLGAYKNMTFSEDNFKAMVANIQTTAGGQLTNAVEAEIDPVLETFKKLYAASLLQTVALRHAFKTKAEARRQTLIAEGKLGEFEALSPNEEGQILDSLSHLVPAYALMNSDFGVNTAVRDFSGSFEVNGKVRKVSSIAGGLSLDIAATQFQNPGVRAAALYVIALGDATMMSEVFNQVRDMLDVFDGLEVSVGSIEETSVLVNKAVHDAQRFDALQAIADSFTRMTLPLDELSDEELRDLVKNMRIMPSDQLALSTREEMITDIQNHISMLELDLATQAKVVRAYKEVFDELPGSNGHMAGSMTVYTYPGTSEQVPVGDEDTVAWIEERVQAKLASQEAPAEAATAVSDTPAQPEPQQESLWAVNHMNRAQVMDMIKKNPFKNPVRQFVFSRIAHLLPKNLAIYSGSAFEMQAKQKEMFPGVTFDPVAAGWFYQDTVFLATAQEETLIHELVHAAVETVVLQFYSNAGKGLTALQREGMKQIDQLVKQFINLDLSQWDDSIENGVMSAQATVQEHWAKGEYPEAVSEFLAWVSANEEVHAALKETPGVDFMDGLRTLAKRVRTFVRKLLGLPANNTMDTFLEQALVAMEAVTRETGTSFSGRMLPLNHSMGGTPAVGAQDIRLGELARQFEEMLANFPNDGRDRDMVLLQHIEPAILAADKIRDAFTDAGFSFTPQEENAFKKLQALFASTIQLDANTLTALQNIYNTVMPQLKPEDFLDDPLDRTAPAMTAAKKRLKALTDIRTKHVDALGRSNALANFVALAMVYEPMRRKLESLAVPKSKIEGENLDQKIRSAATMVFNWMSKTASAANQAQNQRAAIDALMGRLHKNQKAMVARMATKPSLVTKAEQQASKILKVAANKADAKMRERMTAGLIGGTNGWINQGLNLVRAMGSADDSEATAEATLEWSNESNFPKPLRQLINELTGVTKSTYPVAELLNIVRHEVSRVRQRLRDEVPDQVRGLFTQKLTKDQWTSLHRLVGKADLQSLFGPLAEAEVRGILRDPANLAAAIARLEAQLGPHAIEQVQAAKDLAQFMMTHQNVSQRFLWRNADAIAQMAGTGRRIDQAEAERSVPLLDALISLRAVERFSAPEKAFLGGLMDTDPKGIKGLVRLMRTLNQAEFDKPDYPQQALNRWKGFVPASLDPRDVLVLADLTQGADLIKQGYRRLSAYQGDPLDPNQGLHYYAVTWSGGQATYNQGALQTVEGSVGGVDRLTGRTLEPGVGTMITDPQTVARITHQKLRHNSNSQLNLLPVFDNNGDIVAYERVLDPGLVDTHLTGKKDLAQSIGMWMGRQAEEKIARVVNRDLVDILKESWNEGKRKHRESEYVAVSDPNASPIIRETWGAIPRETQDMLERAFGKGPVMVRMDMLENALGYRSASIGNVFTGMSDLPVSTQKIIRDAAFGLMGAIGKEQDTYRYLVLAERTWQNLIATAKDVIVVRSGTVALANGVANQFQLIQMGVPPGQLLQSQVRKIRETETYLRNERRLAQLQFEMAAAHGPKQREKLDADIQALEDANRRLSIWPLIAAGHLPTIAEGLTEQDEYTVLKDFTGWLEEKVKDIPEGLTTTAKYALITKDTALYLGLNRMIQFGDFMAKAVSYDHFISQGMTQEESIFKVNETFVNYNLLPGRTRDYLESMGMTWFMNYKIRIAKIVGRTLRDNPLRFLAAGIGAEVVGADSLMSSNPFTMNLSYATGPGQLFKAHDAILWEQMMDAY